MIGANARFLSMVLGLYSVAFATGSALLGTLLLIGGSARMAGPSFAPILDLAPYWFWGVAFCSSGLVTLAGQFFRRAWPVLVGHMVAGVASLFWVGAFTVAVYKAHQATELAKAAGLPLPPQPAFTGIAAYLVLGVVHCMAAGLTPRWPGHGGR